MEKVGRLESLKSKIQFLKSYLSELESEIAFLENEDLKCPVFTVNKSQQCFPELSQTRELLCQGSPLVLGNSEKPIDFNKIMNDESGPLQPQTTSFSVFSNSNQHYI